MMNEKKIHEKIHTQRHRPILDTQGSLMHTHISEYTYTYISQKRHIILLISNYIEKINNADSPPPDIIKYFIHFAYIL